MLSNTHTSGHCFCTLPSLASTPPSLAAWLDHYLHSVTCPQTSLSGEGNVQSLKGQGRVGRTQDMQLRLLAWLQDSPEAFLAITRG